MNLSTLQQKFALTGRTALVTGAGRGIGQGIALALAKAGANVVALDIHEANARETADLAQSAAGVRAFAYTADLTQTERIPDHLTEIIKRAGAVDILVNNAGFQVRKPSLEFTLAEWNSVVQIHLTASFALAQAAGKGMIERRRGAIINIASINSVMAVPHIVAYTAAKSGVAGLTRSLAVEWAPHGVRVNAIGPGFCRTALTEPLLRNDAKRDWALGRIPLKRFAEPENDLGYVAVFLASDAAAYITGQVIYVDGGWLAG